MKKTSGFDKNKVVVVIPRYKEELTSDEKISLTQCKKVLNRYRIAFISPEKMRYFYEQTGEDAEFFPDECFKSIKNYSEMLLDRFFYERFQIYDYLLIYQLDAFVFDDKLQYYCGLGYDFIGAPMPFFTFRYLYQMGYLDQGTYVGNGGFSLRRISKFISVTRRKEELYSEMGKRDDDYITEDHIYSLFGMIPKYKLSVPPINVAKQFAIEFDVDNDFAQLSENNLPFGIHAWSKGQFRGLWKQYIEKKNPEYHVEAYGFDYINDYFNPILKTRFAEYLFWALCIKNVLFKEIIKKKVIKREVIIWGYGERGTRFVELMNMINVNHSAIWDRNYKNKHASRCIEKPFMNFDNYSSPFIVITPKANNDSIEKELINHRLRKNDDYVTFDEFICGSVESYNKKSIWELYAEQYLHIG